MSDRKESDAEIQRVVRFVGYASQEALLFDMTKTWSTTDFLYAIDRLEIDQTADKRELLRGLYRELRVEREAADARKDSEDASARRHSDLSSRLEELKKPHWTVLPNFWLTAVSALAAILAAYLAWLALKK